MSRYDDLRGPYRGVIVEKYPEKVLDRERQCHVGFPIAEGLRPASTAYRRRSFARANEHKQTKVLRIQGSRIVPDCEPSLSPALSANVCRVWISDVFSHANCLLLEPEQQKGAFSHKMAIHDNPLVRMPGCVFIISNPCIAKNLVDQGSCSSKV